jgi:hypothetical protein
MVVRADRAGGKQWQASQHQQSRERVASRGGRLPPIHATHPVGSRSIGRIVVV